MVPFPRKPAGQGPQSQDPSGELLHSTPAKHGLDRQPSTRGSCDNTFTYDICFNSSLFPWWDLLPQCPNYTQQLVVLFNTVKFTTSYSLGLAAWMGGTNILARIYQIQVDTMEIAGLWADQMLHASQIVPMFLWFVTQCELICAHQWGRAFCYSCHCQQLSRYTSCHHTEAGGCCTHAS